MTSRPCVGCGTVFEYASGWFIGAPRKFCRACRPPAKPAQPQGEHPCDWCGATVVGGTLDRPKRFCCDKCRYTSRDQGRRDAGRWVPVGTEVERVCVDCREPFTFVQRKRPRLRCAACQQAKYGRSRVSV